MTTTEFVEIVWTSGSLDEARKISRALVEKRLVACAQITPWIESIYLWNDKLETTQESRVAFKTAFSRYDEVAKFIKAHCSYEIPEITYRHIDGGDADYLNWAQSVS